jgi:hypothetical protein
MADSRTSAPFASHRNPLAWVVGGALVLALAVGGLFAFRALPAAHADAFTGCHGVTLSSAQASASGYSLSVQLVAQYGNGGEFGTAYCGSMKTVATMTVPAGGAGGTFTVSLNEDTGTTLSNTYTFPNAGTSSYSFTESSPAANPKCATGSATFSSTAGLVLTATTGKGCPK